LLDPTTSAGWLAQLATRVFNRLDQYASSPGNRTYCYPELAVSFLAVVSTIASTHCAYLPYSERFTHTSGHPTAAGRA